MSSQEESSNIVTYQLGPSKIHINYCLVKNDQGKLVKDMKGLPCDKYHPAKAINL